MKSRNYYILFTIVITLCLLNSCSSFAEGEPTVAVPSRTPSPDAIAEAERLFAQREDTDNLREAVKIMAGLRDPSGRSYEVEWKFSKYSYFLGKSLEDENEAEAILEKGLEAGRIASRVEPDKPDGHFWLAANLGELSKLSPVTVGIKSVDDIREAVNKVVELDPAYQSGSSYAALGQLEMKTRLYGGDAEKAVEYLEKGVEIGPDNAMVRADLVEAYLAVRRDADARRQIEALLKMEPHPDYRPEHAEAVAKAKRLRDRNF
jgi:tetratricopeptide (TPR) repeat protein